MFKYLKCYGTDDDNYKVCILNWTLHVNCYKIYRADLCILFTCQEGQQLKLYLSGGSGIM